MGRSEHVVLGPAFYRMDDVTLLARLVLGKYLFTSIDGILTGGMITETEAYKGIHDRASHAYNGRRTERTRIMYAEGGTAYVYLCYGIHSLFNIVTNEEGVPDAILIRRIRITHGMEPIGFRLKRQLLMNEMVSGPGLVSRALGITTDLTGLLLVKKSERDAIWLEDRGIAVPEGQVNCTPRIGVDYAMEDALLPYRYVWIPEK